MSATSNGSSPTTRVVVSPLDRGMTGWAGFAYYYDYDDSAGIWSLVNYGFYPDRDYHAGSAVLNLFYVHDDPLWKIRNVAMHEIGHVFGLMHSNVIVALLNSDIYSYYTLLPPQLDDTDGVYSIYE